MNKEDIQNLENELKDMQPKAPSKELYSHIESELLINGAGASGDRIIPFLIKRLAPIAIAASLGFAVGYSIFKTDIEPSKDSEPNQLAAKLVANQPISVAEPAMKTQQIFKRINDGIINSYDSNPTQQFRYQLLETTTWKKPEKSITLQYQEPREQIVRVQVRHF